MRHSRERRASGQTGAHAHTEVLRKEAVAEALAAAQRLRDEQVVYGGRVSRQLHVGTSPYKDARSSFHDSEKCIFR